MININDTAIPDCKLISPQLFYDARGYFLQVLDMNQYQQQLNLTKPFIQFNQSYSTYGVIRGLHAQTGNAAQTKLISVLAGTILDVVVDIRPNSAHFGQANSLILNSDSKQQLLIPQGFLHGFAVLSTDAIVQYYVDAPYKPAAEIGVIYNDSTLNIDWQIKPEDIIISNKDSLLAKFDSLANY